MYLVIYKTNLFIIYVQELPIFLSDWPNLHTKPFQTLIPISIRLRSKPVALRKTIAKKNTTTDVLRTLNPDIDGRKLKLRQVLKYQQASKRRSSLAGKAYLQQ
jgi:hypothetical protein